MDNIVKLVRDASNDHVLREKLDQNILNALQRTRQINEGKLSHAEAAKLSMRDVEALISYVNINYIRRIK